jgi:neutral ceramidase
MPRQRRRLGLAAQVFAITASVIFTMATAHHSHAAEGMRPAGTVPVGLARIDITPDFPVRLAGYAGRMDEATEVVERLTGKALALGGDDGDGPAVLILLENCSATGELTAELVTRLTDQAGVRPERCVVASTHTHSAPLLPEFAPWHYSQEMPPEHLANMDRYRRELIDRLEQVALEALAARRPAHLAWSQGAVTFGRNRRVLENGQWVGFLPGDAAESPGPVDHSLPVLRVTDPDGKPIGLVANYACHCTTTSGSYNAIHGDWAGYAQKALEADHPGVLAMVTIGCGADVGPYPNGTLERAQQYGRQLADEVGRLLEGDWTPLSPELVARQETIQVPLGQLPTREQLQQQADADSWFLGARDVARHFLGILDRDGALPQSFDYPITTWTFGDDLAMIFLPGEVTVDYALRLKRELDGSRLWVTAYANGMPCYIVPRRLLDEGGYEVDSSMISYGQPTRLAPEAEDTIVDAVRRLLPPAWNGNAAR